MTDLESDLRPAKRYRFGVFEADAATGELRRQGMRVKLNAQPFQILLMLLERPGQLLTRDEISRVLWPEGTFVDYEHGVNSAVNRIREALGDTAGSPRFVETLARRGYRFLAPVELIPAERNVERAPLDPIVRSASIPPQSASTVHAANPSQPDPQPRMRILSTPEDLPKTSFAVVQTLFVLFQLMYLGFYIRHARQPRGDRQSRFAIALIRTRLPLHFRFGCHSHSRTRLHPLRRTVPRASVPRKIPHPLAVSTFFDELWSLSPFLLLHHINFGVALACTTLLVYSPFAQRSIVLMGAGGAPLNARI